MYGTWHHKTCFRVQLHCAVILLNVSSFWDFYKPSVVGQAGMYFCSYVFVFAWCLTPGNKCGLPVLPTQNTLRTHQSALEKGQLFVFSFLAVSIILQMWDIDCSHHLFLNLISFWLELPTTTPQWNSEIEIFHPFFFQGFSTLKNDFHYGLCHGRCSSPSPS